MYLYIFPLLNVLYFQVEIIYYVITNYDLFVRIVRWFHYKYLWDRQLVALIGQYKKHELSVSYRRLVRNRFIPSNRIFVNF